MGRKIGLESGLSPQKSCFGRKTGLISGQSALDMTRLELAGKRGEGEDEEEEKGEEKEEEEREREGEDEEEEKRERVSERQGV